jgi:hypothetical protein
MREQCGLSLKARRLAFNAYWNLGISLRLFRRLYREMRITKQMMTSRLGGKKLQSQEMQMDKIRELQNRMQSLHDAGYELLQSDESLFSADGYNGSHWAPIGQPLRKDSRWASAKPVVVYGVISPLRGVVHWHFGEHSFNAQDICDALQEVRVKVGDGVKIAMMMDNARIHRAKIVKQLIESPEVDIEPIWNCTARPDLATIGKYLIVNKGHVLSYDVYHVFLYRY